MFQAHLKPSYTQELPFSDVSAVLLTEPACPRSWIPRWTAWLHLRPAELPFDIYRLSRNGITDDKSYFGVLIIGCTAEMFSSWG